jgi:hypothetical protein
MGIFNERDFVGWRQRTITRFGVTVGIITQKFVFTAVRKFLNWYPNPRWTGTLLRIGKQLPVRWVGRKLVPVIVEKSRGRHQTQSTNFRGDGKSSEGKNIFRYIEIFKKKPLVEN